MKIFVYEYVCGGGMIGEDLPEMLSAQGMAMLRVVISDFMELGAQVTTTLDSRVDGNIDGASMHVVEDKTKTSSTFDELAIASDAVLVIAPEFGGISAGLAVRLEHLDVHSLGSTSSAIALCADKLALADHLRRAGLRTPTTAVYEPNVARPYPVVIKPRDGAGCEGTFVCQTAGDAGRMVPDENQVVQPYCAGKAVSVSLLLHDGEVTPLLAGRQCIIGDEYSPVRLRYDGGHLALVGEEAGRATVLATRVAECVNGLRGFVGIDLVLGETLDMDHVIEINPRLTVSYAGLRKLAQTNLAAAMLDVEAPVRFADGSVRFDAAGNVEQMAVRA